MKLVAASPMSPYQPSANGTNLNPKLRGAYGRGRTAEGLYERFLHHVHLGDINETSNVRSEQVPLCFPVTNR